MAGGSDFLVGMVGDGFTLVAADTQQSRSVVMMKTNLDKMITLSSKTVMLLGGEVGDCTHFGEFIQKNLKLNQLRNGHECSPHGAAHYTRTQLAKALRSRNSYQCNLLLGGFDEEEGPSLYWIDYLAAMAKVPFAAHGYGSFFTLSTMDAHYKPGMSLEEALDLLRKVITEINTRFVMNIPRYIVRVADKDGVREVDFSL